jgi:hypothetical protein
MADHIRYDLLTQQALRGVVRNVLTDAAKKGLPGDHHFYIAFDTNAEGVRMPDRLRAQYPNEMTIILQHQFWDLKVFEDAFEVGLSFGGVPATLHVPFEAVKGFFDPSVQFGLQFEDVSEEEAQRAAPANVQDKAPEKAAEKGSGKRLPGAAAPAVAPAPAAAPAAAAPKSEAKIDAKTEAESEAEPKPAPAGGAEVVRLDRFRKK